MARTITLDQPTVSFITTTMKDYLAKEVGIPSIKLSHIRHGLAKGLGYANGNALSADLKDEAGERAPVDPLLQPETWITSGHVSKAVDASRHTDAEILGEKAADHIIAEAIKGAATLRDLAILRWHAEMAVLAYDNGELADRDGAQNRWTERAQLVRAALRARVGAERLVRSARDVRPGDKVRDLYSVNPWDWQVVEEVNLDADEIRMRLPNNNQVWVDVSDSAHREGLIVLERARKGRPFDPVTECRPPAAAVTLLADRPAAVRLPADGRHGYVGSSSLSRLRALLGEPATGGLLHPRAQIEWWLRFEDGAEAVLSARLPVTGRYNATTHAPDALHFAIFPADGVPLERIVSQLHDAVGTLPLDMDLPNLGGLRTDIDIVFGSGLAPVDLLESHLFWRAERLDSPLPGRIRRFRIAGYESEPVDPAKPLRPFNASKEGIITPEWFFPQTAIDFDEGHMDVTLVAADDAAALAQLAETRVAAGETVLLVGKAKRDAVHRAAQALTANGATVWHVVL